MILSFVEYSTHNTHNTQHTTTHNTQHTQHRVGNAIVGVGELESGGVGEWERERGWESGGVGAWESGSVGE